MRLVIIESPFAGNVEENIRYARACMKDCLMRGEAPYASHLLYTQEGVLDDENPDERRLGMEAGFAWARCFEDNEGGSKPNRMPKRVIYTDLGISGGMQEAISLAYDMGQEVEYRALPVGYY
jgi:hypothetical protein